MKAIWNGAVIAESDDTVVVEGSHYFPMAALRREYLQASEKHTVCAWKGQASYYHVVVDGKVNENAAWYYPQPAAAAEKIKDHVAFWHAVQVTP
jgi:uncharacterized protein (DUF427 family)